MSKSVIHRVPERTEPIWPNIPSILNLSGIQTSHEIFFKTIHMEQPAQEDHICLQLDLGPFSE